jgi:2-dehydro-3-deoxyphosphogluconate aldolase/(4S)-4-hydroxy-2-oxoglutarate aldolase
MSDNLLDNNSIIISLDVDALLFDKLEEISTTKFTVVEINSSDYSILEQAIANFPNLQIGAGNIVNSQQLENCCKARVRFITSPGFLPTLAQTAEIYSVKYLPGISTISEGMQALAIDCHVLKVYPANYELCKILSNTLPLLRLLPTGVAIKDADKYLDIPAVAAVVINNPEISDLKIFNKTMANA